MMTITTPESFAVTYHRLTRKQVREMDRLHDRRRAVDDSQRLLDMNLADLHASVHDALEAGVPARIVAEQSRLSISRVYQIRDLVARFRE